MNKRIIELINMFKENKKLIKKHNKDLKEYIYK